MTLLVVAWPSREINIQRETGAETTKTTTTTARSSHTHTPFLSDTHSREEVGARRGRFDLHSDGSIHGGAAGVLSLMKAVDGTNLLVCLIIKSELGSIKVDEGRECRCLAVVSRRRRL